MSPSAVEEIVALLPLTLYILTILYLHTLLPSSALPLRPPKSLRQAVFHLLAMASLGVTWHYMLSFLKWSYHSYHAPLTPKLSIQSLAAWTRGTGVFEQAWRIVCESPTRFWWSSQLCTFTAGIWTMFLWEQSRRRGIKKVWLYMLIAQLVAVSWASALFWAVLETAGIPEKKRDVVYASRRLVWTTITATLTSYLLYIAIPTPYFLGLLVVVHFLLFLPLVESMEGKESTISISQLYAINGTLCVTLHVGNCIWLFQRGEFGSLWDVIWEHPAMSSVAWDVIFCAIIGVVGTRRWTSITLPPVISVGATMGGIHSIFASYEYQK